MDNDVGMRRLLCTRLLSLTLLAGCGGAEDTVTSEAPCEGLQLKVMDRAVAPPANVAAVVRVTRCAGETLTTRLTADDFQLAEDSEILSQYEASRTVDTQEQPVAERVVVLLDLSGSISRAGLKPQMIEGARKLVRALMDGRAIALYGFDGRANLVPFAVFSSDAEVLMEALDSILDAPVVDDSTNLNGAVVNALSILDEAVQSQAQGPNAIAHGSLILFTDGTDRAARLTQAQAERAVLDSPHSTFAIGVGEDTDANTLSGLGRNGHHLVSNPDTIVDAFEKVARVVRARAHRDYMVSYCSPARAGTHRLAITVQSGDLSGSTSLTFNADQFGAGCDPAASPLKQ